jgi:hypothetical protein
MLICLHICGIWILSIVIMSAIRMDIKHRYCAGYKKILGIHLWYETFSLIGDLLILIDIAPN